MATGWQAIIGIGLIVMLFIFVWLVIQLQRLSKALSGDKKPAAGNPNQALDQQAIEESSHLFNKEFREELRNRGRLKFESIINQNAMFLKQDLDMTVAQLNEYLKQQIGGKMNDEFAAYTKAMDDARDLAMASLQKSVNAVETQRDALNDALYKEVAEREAVLLKEYEENMAKIIEHYILQALGDQFNLKDQLPFIIAQMEANKQAIVEDMRL
jgi:hypothetical protein